MTVINSKQHTTGFALLMTLLVISVIIPVAITILDVTSKQVRLAGNARDSEVAFHAANAGLECAQRIRRAFAPDMEDDPGRQIGASCFGGTAPVSSNVEPDTPVQSINGHVNHYRYEFTWGTFPLERCTQIDTILIVSEPNQDTSVTAEDIRDVIPSYPTTAVTKSCAESSVCTIISSRGYNRSCSQISGGGTIQREVLLEY